MLGRRLIVVTFALLLVTAVSFCARAQAARVLVMGRHGQVRRENNRFISADASLTPARGRARAGTVPVAPIALPELKQRKRPVPQVTVPSVLAKLARTRRISAAAHATYLDDWKASIGEERVLSRTRAAQLDPVTEMIHRMAVAGSLTASRLPVLFLTLARNAQWWKSGPMLSHGERVQFSGSQLEWEYYTDEGIQLQVLGTFGEANGLYEAGRASWPRLISLMSEMIPLAVRRGGGLAWEYYFDWEGGSPPWVSAMAQATGLEALANAYEASGNAAYLSTGASALGILKIAPPAGVAVPTASGTRFLQYSFAPHTDIINAFLQTLVGLDDFAKVSGNLTAAQLFAAGNAQAMSELPTFNTGAWSLYQPGVADDLSYHQLVIGFLGNLCTLTGTPVYCTVGQDFATDLKTPPVIAQVTHEAAAKRGMRLYFTLDKPARVGVVVANADGKDVLYTSAVCDPGNDYWVLGRLRPGNYSVKLSGTDLADNYATTSGTLTVS